MANRLPIQPVYTDEDGVLRFRGNKVVRYLLDHGSLDLNDLARKVRDCPEDWAQFAQLIGYSLSGFGSLSYGDSDTYEVADRMAREGMTEQEARIDYLEKLLAGVRQDARALALKLFDIHPDDLGAADGK